MIIVENEHAIILGISDTADATVAWAQITVVHVGGNLLLFARDSLSTPWPVLAMSGNNYPLFTERVPAFFPDSFD
jgi:hypothetical protein